MNITLWILQGLLAVAYLGAGSAKLIQPRAKLQPAMPYVEDLPEWLIKFIGAVEVLGAGGLILPGLTGVAPVLTPLAATGLAILQVLAGLLHVRRREFSNLPINAALCGIAAIIVWGRFVVAPLAEAS
ncbi:MAG: DoxX family protein [Haloechinothrix sp.]